MTFGDFTLFPGEPLNHVAASTPHLLLLDLVVAFLFMTNALPRAIGEDLHKARRDTRALRFALPKCSVRHHLTIAYIPVSSFLNPCRCHRPVVLFVASKSRRGDTPLTVT